MTENIEGIEELKASIKEIYEELDVNIAEISNRISELSASIEKRGTESLTAVQENTKDKTELDQLNEVYRTLTAKRSKLIEDNSQLTYTKIDAIRNKYLAEREKKRIENDVSLIKEYWDKIKEIDEKIKNDRYEEGLKIESELVQLKPYLNETSKHNLERMVFSINGGMDYARQIKEGYLY